MFRTKRPMFGAVGALLLAAVVAVPALAQGILIDKPVRAGALIAFPDANDATSYYYVNDKPMK